MTRRGIQSAAPWLPAIMAALVAVCGGWRFGGWQAESRQPTRIPAAMEPDSQAIESGRDALGSRWRYPWYDGSRDEIRRVRFKVPSSLPDWRLRAPNVSFQWLEVLIWILALAALALLAYVLVRAWLHFKDLPTTSAAEQAGRPMTADDAARVEALPFRIRKGALDLLSEARALYQQGNYREAVIYLFSYQLVEMDKNAVIRLSKGKTNRQYLRDVGRQSALRELVEQTMVAFEDVFFGDHDLPRRRFEACWNRLDEFERLLQRVPA